MGADTRRTALLWPCLDIDTSTLISQTSLGCFSMHQSGQQMENNNNFVIGHKIIFNSSVCLSKNVYPEKLTRILAIYSMQAIHFVIWSNLYIFNKDIRLVCQSEGSNTRPNNKEIFFKLVS